MNVLKLFEKKDKYGLYDLIKSCKELHKFILKLQNGKYDPSIDEVIKIITDVKRLKKNAENIKIELNKDNEIKSTKKNLFMLKLLNERLEMLTELELKVLTYEKQLNEYETLKGVKNEIKKD